MSILAYCLLFVTVSSAYAQTKVPVSVYYESLCPDSIKFFVNQLYPTWNTSLKANMELVLVPFGKANYTNNSGNYTFTCDHGEKECLGNKVQACALKRLDNMDTEMKFINCLMNKVKGAAKEAEYPTKSCIEETKINPDALDAINSCVESTQGSEYLAALGNMTMTMNIRRVPTIVFNNKMDSKNNDAAFSDFRGTLCSMISGTKPAECNKNSGSTVYPALALISLIFLFITRL